MKISTKGRYGLRAMLDLAVHSGGSQVPLLSIAERQGISVNYLEQMFSQLRKAGLVKSVKGAQGGYILADKPDRIRVGAVLRVLEGNLDVVDQRDETRERAENPLEDCIRRCVWEKMNESINRAADSVTLGDLMENYLNEESSPMFYI